MAVELLPVTSGHNPGKSQLLLYYSPLPLHIPALQHREQPPGMQHKAALTLPAFSFPGLSFFAWQKSFVPILQSCLQLILEEKKEKRYAL